MKTKIQWTFNILLCLVSLFCFLHYPNQSTKIESKIIHTQFMIDEVKGEIIQRKNEYLNYLTHDLLLLENGNNKYSICLTGKCFDFFLSKMPTYENVSVYLNKQTNRFGLYYVDENTIIPIYLYQLVYAESKNDEKISAFNFAIEHNFSNFEYAYSSNLTTEELENLKILIMDSINLIDMTLSLSNIINEPLINQGLYPKNNFNYIHSFEHLE